MVQDLNRPLKPGTVVSYADIPATVLCDYGTSMDVLCEGTRQTWRWNLDGESCKVLSAPRGQLVYRDFDAYVSDFPEAEGLRGWLTSGRHEALLIVKLIEPIHEGSPHGGIVGNYMWLSLSKASNGQLRIAAHDCDDGLMVRDFPVEQEAEAWKVLEDIAALAPHSMWDVAKVFGFGWE